MEIQNNSWDSDYEQSKLNPIYEPLWEILKEFYQDKDIKTVLDFACGDGNYSFLMQKDGLELLGIDLSKKAIKKALSYKEIQKIDNIDFKIGDTILDEIKSNSFDLVVLLNSFHCLKKQERVDLLSKIKRVLKQNQYLFISVLSLEDESYPRDQYKQIEDNTFDDGRGRIFHFFSYEEILKELKDFKILNIKTLENIHPELKRKSSLYVIMASL